MSKLGIGVGDEFPVEEIHRDEHGVVHHHHYHRRRRHCGLLRIILTIALVVLVFRALHYATLLPLWENAFGLPHPYMPLGGILVAIAVIGGLLWLLSHRRHDGHW